MLYNLSKLKFPFAGTLHIQALLHQPEPDPEKGNDFKHI